MREVRKSLLEGEPTHLSLLHSPGPVASGERAPGITQHHVYPGDLVETTVCA